MPAAFNLPLSVLADSVYQDAAVVSQECGNALEVHRGVLDGQLALLVPAAVGEPASLNLIGSSLFLLLAPPGPAGPWHVRAPRGVAAGPPQGKLLGEKESVASWMGAVTCGVHSMAVAGCLGDKGLSVATGYLSTLAHLAAEHGFALCRAYDLKLCPHAAASEESTVDDVVILCHGTHGDTFSMVPTEQTQDTLIKVRQVQQQNQHAARSDQNALATGHGRHGQHASGPASDGHGKR